MTPASLLFCHRNPDIQLILLSAVSRETGGTKDDVQSRMWHDEAVKQHEEEE